MFISDRRTPTLNPIIKNLADIIRKSDKALTPTPVFQCRFGIWPVNNLQ